jgi:hypothetical protein
MASSMSNIHTLRILKNKLENLSKGWKINPKRGEGSGMAYKTLEQQIRELWASRGLEVIEEQFESVGKNKFKWTIIARKKKEAQEFPK